MVLGAEVGLHSLAVPGAPIEDVVTRRIAAHKGDGLLRAGQSHKGQTEAGQSGL